MIQIMFDKVMHKDSPLLLSCEFVVHCMIELVLYVRCLLVAFFVVACCVALLCV